MVMDDTEIINSFKQAKDKKNQVQVLADLNGISKKEMQEHLKTLGLEVPPLRGGARKDPPGTGAPVSSLATLLGDLCRQYPDAKVRAGSGEVNAVTVTSRYLLDGSIAWTEIRLDAVASKGHG